MTEPFGAFTQAFATALPRAAESRMVATRDRHSFFSCGTTQSVRDLAFPWRDGDTYHIFTQPATGFTLLDILDLVAAAQRVRAAILSSWTMHDAGVARIRGLLASGRVERLDVYGGDQALTFHAGHFDALREIIGSRGRVMAAYNHAKILAVFGTRFDCAAETSKNIKADSVHIETAAVTVGSALPRFFADFYDALGAADGAPPCTPDASGARHARWAEEPE